jgi:shikimate kinase
MSSQSTDELPIFLVGFMGSGKSTIGTRLAAKLDRPFIDLDHLIETTIRRSIAELIDDRGEDEFRAIESRALREGARSGAPVIATGGGVILRAENRELMSKTGVTVWLDAPFELCWHRIIADAAVRPLAPDRETALARYHTRNEYYKESRFHIEIGEDLTADAAADVIVRLLADL